MDPAIVILILAASLVVILAVAHAGRATKRHGDDAGGPSYGGDGGSGDCGSDGGGGGCD